MRKTLKIYEHRKNLEGEVWGQFGPCPLVHLWCVPDMSLGVSKVVNMD